MTSQIDFAGLFIFILTVIAAGVILWIGRRQKKQHLQKIKEFAGQCGWQYKTIEDNLVSGYCISKGEWTLEGIRSFKNSSTSLSSSTCWWTKSVLMPEGIVLIGPRQSTEILAGIGDRITQAALQIMIGADAEYAQGIREMEISRTALRERYMVWTNQEETAKRLFDLDVENALINLPKKLPLVVKFTPLCLEVKIQTTCLEKPEEIIALVKLGEALQAAAG